MDNCRKGKGKGKLKYTEYKPHRVSVPSTTDTTYTGLGSMTGMFLEKLHKEKV